MRHSDRNVGKNFGKSKLWKGKEAKKIMLPQFKFRVPRRGQSVHEG